MTRRAPVRNANALARELARQAHALRELVAEELATDPESALRRLAFELPGEVDLQPSELADVFAQTVVTGLVTARLAGQGLDDIAVTSPFLRGVVRALHERRADDGRRALAMQAITETLARIDPLAVDDDAVQDPALHFFEGFLAEYDPQQRKDRGVFYTPRPLVRYIVRSVDRVLRTHLGLADGLADTTTWGELVSRRSGLRVPAGVSPDERFVTILDPAMGTGTFLVEIIRTICDTMFAKWKSEGAPDPDLVDRWNAYVPEELLPRLHGYELMVAPYAIAHLAIGRVLRETGYRFERDAPVRLTRANALRSDLPREHVTIVMGNPPYGRSSAEVAAWVTARLERYHATVGAEEIQRQALANDYVKFMAMASALLARSPARVLGIVTDSGYLDGPLFRDLRADLVESYSCIEIADLGGNYRRIDASAVDENVFYIQQGVAVLIGHAAPGVERSVRYRAIRGTRSQKAAWLAADVAALGPADPLTPEPPSFDLVARAHTASREWARWASLPELFAGGVRSGRPLPFNGAALATRQDSLVVAFTRGELEEKLRAFFDPAETRSSLGERFRLCTTSHFSFERARSELSSADAIASIRPILYRPFDVRFVAYHPRLVGEPRAAVMKHLLADGVALLSTRRVTGRPYDNVFVCRGLVEYKAVTHDRNTQVFPLYLVEDDGERRPNLAPALLARWADVGATSPEDVFHAVYAILHSAEYRRRYRGELGRGYARTPRPSAPDLLLALRAHGARLVELHLAASEPAEALRAGPVIDGPIEWVDGSVRCARGSKGEAWVIADVPPPVWRSHVGGYRVCRKWLEDRRGRALSMGELARYRRMVAALAETLSRATDIDRLIDAHGGWPRAFELPRA